MKRKLYYGLMAVIAIALFSCTDEETISISDNGVNVTGSFSSAVPRTTYTDSESSVSVAWEAGDQIGLVSASDNTVYKYAATLSGSTTDFEPASSAISDADGEIFYAWYPYSGYSDDSYPNAALPNIFEQTYSANGMSPEYDFIYSKGVVDNNELTLIFSHLFAFLEISIDPELLDFMGFLISSSDDIAVKSDSYYNFSSDSVVGTTSKSLYYDISDEYLEGEDMITCYVAILPTSSSSYITIRNLHGSTSSYSIGEVISTKYAPTGGFKAGYIYTMTLIVPSIEVSQSEIEVPAEGGSYDLTVTSNVDYEVSVDVDWITFISDGDTYTFTVNATESTDQRTATITISGEGITKEVNITQEGATLLVSSDEVTVAAKGETVTLTVTANAEYTVSTDADWLTLVSDIESSSLSITVSANESTESRSAVITVANENLSVTVNVTQEGGYLVYSGESNVSIAPEINTLELTLSTNVDYTVETSASWINLNSAASSGSNKETLTFNVDTNDSTNSRSSTISISWGDTVYDITVTQEGAYLEVSQTEYSVSSDGGTFDITVNSNVGYSVAVDSSWLTYTQNSNTLNFTVDKATGSESRSATMTLSWNSLTCTINVSQSGSAGSTGTIDDLPIVNL